jgi:hypothetical protein
LLELKVGEGEELGVHGVARLFESNAELACDAAATEIFRRIGVAQQKDRHDDVLAIVCEMRNGPLHERAAGSNFPPSQGAS